MEDREIYEVVLQIVDRMKNQNLARTLAENLVNGQLGFLVQSDIEKVNQGTGCHITLDDVYYARDLMLHQRLRNLNEEMDQISLPWRNENRHPMESERMQVDGLLGQLRTTQETLAAKYHHLSAFGEVL